MCAECAEPRSVQRGQPASKVENFAVSAPKFFWTPAVLGLGLTAGPMGAVCAIYYTMLYVTYRSRLPFEDQDALGFFAQRVGGWMSVRVDCVLYSVPEHLGYLLEFWDPNLERVPREDWIG
jgi:hypothetical protein